MKLIELNAGGTLTGNAIRIVGEEYLIAERIASKSFGLGQLRFTSLPEMASSLITPDQIHKLHFDWTKKGAAIRIKTSHKLLALLIADEEIKKISLVKKEDYIFAFPFSLFWILLRLGVSINTARYFRSRLDKFHPGKCLIALHIKDDHPLLMELDGWLWGNCIATFINSKTKEKSEILDLRTRVKFR